MCAAPCLTLNRFRSPHEQLPSIRNYMTKITFAGAFHPTTLPQLSPYNGPQIVYSLHFI